MGPAPTWVQADTAAEIGAAIIPQQRLEAPQVKANFGLLRAWAVRQRRLKGTDCCARLHQIALHDLGLATQNQQRRPNRGWVRPQIDRVDDAPGLARIVLAMKCEPGKLLNGV